MQDDFIWWRDGIIYQIYPRSFADSNGDGLGDLPGITSRLDYLAELGIDALWLSPFYPSPDADFGYDISDYTNIDPRFGTLVDFDTLVAAAHQRNIRIIVDLVLNHTSDQHPWFLESRSSRNNPKRDWYLWRDHPNNWQSFFGGVGWEWDAATRQHYFHMFARQQPDLNWRNPKVHQEMLEVFRFWAERGVDGFRLDVFNAYFKDENYRDNPRKFGLRGFERYNHLYDINQPEMHPLLNEIRTLLDHYPERYAVGETFVASPETSASYCGPVKLHAAFNFDFTFRKFSAAEFADSIQKWTQATGAEIWPNYVLSNHDQPRSATRYAHGEDDTRAKLALGMLLTLRGTPFLYYGEEIGMRDIRLKRSEILDPPGQHYWPFYTGRDGCRAPMQWDASPQAGFSRAKPWLPVHPNYRQRNVAAQQQDPGSLLNFVKKLIALRRSSPALQRGDFRLLCDPAQGVLSYERQTTAQHLRVHLNFSARPQALPATDVSPSLVFSSHRNSLNQPLQIAPGEVLILQTPA